MLDSEICISGQGEAEDFSGCSGQWGSGLQRSQAFCPSRDTASRCLAGVWENASDLRTGAELLSSASGWDWREQEDVGDRQDHKMRKISGSQTQKDSLCGKKREVTERKGQEAVYICWVRHIFTGGEKKRHVGIRESAARRRNSRALCHLLQEMSPGEFGQWPYFPMGQLHLVYSLLLLESSML